MPFAFTENGVAMLSGVLRSKTAIEMNIRIVRAFVAMRKALASLAPMMTRLEVVERRQITDQSRNEARFEAFGRQYGKLTKSICGICHDRFIIVDGKEIFAVGASLKDAGRQTFAVVKSGLETISGLLTNLRNAITSLKVYG